MDPDGELCEIELFNEKISIDAEILHTGGDRIVSFDRTLGVIAVWNLHELSRKGGESSGSDDLPCRICPWITEQGRISYVSNEGDTCILGKDSSQIEFSAYGLSLHADRVKIGFEQVLIWHGDVIYLYNKAGSLIRKLVIDEMHDVLPAAEGRLVLWNSRSISLFNVRTDDKSYLLGLGSHLDDEPVKGVSVSHCGRTLIGWNDHGQIVAWNLENPQISLKINVNYRIIEMVVHMVVVEVYLATQDNGGVVRVYASTHSSILAQRRFENDKIQNIYQSDGAVHVEFQSGSIWNSKADLITYPTEFPALDIFRRYLRLHKQGWFAEWHSDTEISWSRRLGQGEIFLSTDGRGEILRILSPQAPH